MTANLCFLINFGCSLINTRTMSQNLGHSKLLNEVRACKFYACSTSKLDSLWSFDSSLWPLYIENKNPFHLDRYSKSVNEMRHFPKLWVPLLYPDLAILAGCSSCPRAASRSAVSCDCQLSPQIAQAGAWPSDVFCWYMSVCVCVIYTHIVLINMF